MKTLYTILIIVLFTGISWSQSYLVSTSFKSSSPSRLTTSLSSYTIEVIDNTDFNYRNFLNETESSNSLYRVGNMRISKKELTKIFKKSSRQSRDVYEFSMLLNDEYPTLINQLSEMEVTLLYHTFNKDSFKTYISDLPSFL